MDLRALERLARLVAELDLSEIEVRRLGERIRIVRRPAGAHPAPVAPAHPFVAAVPVQPPAAPPPVAPPPDERPKVTHELATIKAPLVGTFYRAPTPDAPPYVEVGQVVGPGQTVCIIEAMKIMNEIHADSRGKIVSIFPGNGQPVEFGQVLFELDPRI